MASYLSVRKEFPWEAEPPVQELVAKLDKTRPITIAIYGGLGTLTPRFLTPAYKDLVEFLPNVRFVIVDTMDPDALYADPQDPARKKPGREIIRESMEAAGLPWVGGDYQAGINYFMNKPGGFRRRGAFDAAVDRTFNSKDGTISVNGQSLRIDGVITAVPTFLHLDIARRWAPKGVWVWTDKPITMIDQLPALRRIQKKHGHIFAVDFFMDSDALFFLEKFGDGLFERIGPIKAVSGRCFEPWSILKEKGRGPWLMMPWQGGGGLGIDQVVHPLAMIGWDLQRQGVDLSKAVLDHVHLGRSLDPATAQPTRGAPEDYSYFSGYVDGPNGRIEIYVDNGKVAGVKDYFYGFTIEGTRGKIEVSVGTEITPPYIKVTPWFSPEEPMESVLLEFKKGGLGYTRTFLDFVLAIYGSQASSGATVGARFQATTGAVAFVGQGYARTPWQYRVLLMSVIRILPNGLILWFCRTFGHRFPGYAPGTLPAVPRNVPGEIPPEIPRTGVPFFLRQDPDWQVPEAPLPTAPVDMVAESLQRLAEAMQMYQEGAPMYTAFVHADLYSLSMFVFSRHKNLRRAFGDESLMLSALIASGLTVDAMQALYDRIWENHNLDSLINSFQSYRLWGTRVWSWAVLAFDDVRDAVGRFLEAPGGLVAFDIEGFGTSISIALGEPSSREAAKALLGGLAQLGPDKLSLSVLAHKTETVPFFWAYLAPVYNQLRESGMTPQQAGLAMAQLAYQFGTITEALEVPTAYAGIPWTYWHSESLGTWSERLPVDPAIVHTLASRLATGA